MNYGSWKLHFYQGPVPSVQNTPQIDDRLQDIEYILRFGLEILLPSWANGLHKVTNISEQTNSQYYGDTDMFNWFVNAQLQ